MNEPQREFYIRALVDKRVIIDDARVGSIGTSTDGRLRIVVALRAAGLRDMNLGVYDVVVNSLRLIHFESGITGLGGSRSDVLAYLAGRLPSWKLEKLHEILDA